MCMVTTFSGRQGARDARGRALRPVLRAGSGPPDQRVAALHDPAARGLHREAEERLRLAERAIRVARVRAARAAAERSHVDRDQAARAARDVRRAARCASPIARSRERARPRARIERRTAPRASTRRSRPCRARETPRRRPTDGAASLPSHSHSAIRVTRHRPRDYTPRRALCKIRRLPAPLTLCSRLCDSDTKTSGIAHQRACAPRASRTPHATRRSPPCPAWWKEERALHGVLR